jgi:DNA-binding NarL/FixJ family response regulator
LADLAPGRGTVAVLADDLIWASRLIEAVRRAGGTPVRLSSEAELATVLEADAGAELRAGEGDRALVGVVIDLVGRRYDGVAAVERTARARKPVIAVAQHDDQVTRKRALNAGASRVFSYAKFFTDGPRLVEGWLVANIAEATR